MRTKHSMRNLLQQVCYPPTYASITPILSLSSPSSPDDEEAVKAHTRCRGIGTRVGLPKRKQPFKTRMDPIGLQLGRAGQTYGRLPLSNQPYRMPAVGPGATGPPFHRKDDQPSGLQLG